MLFKSSWISVTGFTPAWDFSNDSTRSHSRAISYGFSAKNVLQASKRRADFSSSPPSKPELEERIRQLVQRYILLVEKRWMELVCLPRLAGIPFLARFLCELA